MKSMQKPPSAEFFCFVGQLIKMKKYENHIQRAEALYANGETAKGYLHKKHANFHYGFGGGVLDRFRNPNKKIEAMTKTHNGAEAEWVRQRYELQGKTQGYQLELKNCQNDFAKQKQLYDGLQSSFDNLAKRHRDTEEELEKLRPQSTVLTDPKRPIIYSEPPTYVRRPSEENDEDGDPNHLRYMLEQRRFLRGE